MVKVIDVPEAAPPNGPYSLGFDIPKGARVVVTAGQLGVRPDGTVPEDFKSQAEAAYDNLLKVIRKAGMDMEDIVKMQTFLVRREDFDVYRGVREQVFGDHKPASTMLIVAGLAHPRFLFEVEAIAAKVE